MYIASNNKDRLFWIYLLITLFFTIMGIIYILSVNIEFLSVMAVLWLFSNVLLFLVIYRIVTCEQCDNSLPLTIFVNILFFIILILSVLWTVELTSNNLLSSMSGILIIICGLALSVISSTDFYKFWITVIYNLMWFIMTSWLIYKNQ